MHVKQTEKLHDENMFKIEDPHQLLILMDEE